MKKFILVFSLALASFFSVKPYPQYSDKYVNDFAQIINNQDKENIHDLLEKVDNDLGLEISLVTVNSIKDFDVETNSNFEAFAFGLFNHWKIGDAKSNDGILLLFGLKDRKVRITLGSGYSSAYNRVAQRIVDYTMLPEFKKNMYSRGIYLGTEEIVKNFSTKELQRTFFDKLEDFFVESWYWVLALISVFLGFVVWAIRSSSNRKSRNKYENNKCRPRGYFWALSGHKHTNSHNSGSGSSFGGGSSSGGGASGGW